MNYIILSVPTSGGGATAAATFAFFTEGYGLPRQERSTDSDVVHNQNGVFRYVYDNGPNVRVWQPFKIVCSDDLKAELGSATQQLANLDFLWQHIGALGLRDPIGTYSVHWARAPLERQFREFPEGAGDKLEIRSTVNFEEGG